MIVVLPHGAKPCRQPMTSDFEIVFAVFAKHPGDEDIAKGRYWRSCRSSAIPLLAGLANIEGFPLKSVGGRESVSLSPALSSRPVCRAGSKAKRFSLGQLVPDHLLKLSSWRRALCRWPFGHAGFVPAICIFSFQTTVKS